jgi:type I restriction enzyme S subunit
MSLVVSFEEIFEKKSGLLANHESWRRIELGEVCTILNGFPFKSARFNSAGRGYPIVRIRDLSKKKPDTFYDGKVPDEFIVRDGDLLIGMDGVFRCKEWNGGLAGLNQRVCKLIPDERYLDRRFVMFGMNGYLKAIQDATSSVTVGHLSSLDILKIPFPLLPIAEQQRLVSKLAILLERVDGSQGRLANIYRILKRFRQSVLAAACSGRLTADWRSVNAESEPGSALLDRVKAKRLKMAESAKDVKQINEAFDAAFLDIDDAELGVNGVPTSWIACRVGAIGAVVNGSTPSRKQSAYWDGTIPWVSSGEVRNNVIFFTREKISKSGYANCSVRLLPPGTVLLAMIGEGKTRGQSAILEIEATINQNIAAIVVSHGLVESEFIWRWFQFQYNNTRERGSGSGPQALNCQRVREIPFVLPPLDEQGEISRRVNELFAFADKIEARYEAVKRQVDRLPPSILAKAFRGELVPTEAELAEREGRAYESSEQLLARIRAERETPVSRKRAART